MPANANTADGHRSRYSGMFNVISVINLGFWSELCVQRILTLWGRVYLLELEWKCQSLSYFSPPPFSGVLVKHVMSAGGSIGCACAPAEEATCLLVRVRGRVMLAQLLTRRGPPWLLLCRNTWLHIRNSLNGGAEVCRQPTDGTFSNAHVFEKKYISLKSEYYFKDKKNKTKNKWFLFSLASFLSSGFAPMCNFSTSFRRQDCCHV